MEVNGLIVEASKNSLKGYSDIKYSFVEEVYTWLYKGTDKFKEGMGRLLSVRKFMEDKSVGDVSVSLSKVFGHVLNLVDRDFLATFDNNSNFKAICLKGLLPGGNSYAELAFQAVCVGAASLKGYLRYFKDLEEFLGRFDVLDKSGDFYVTDGRYRKIMIAYLSNMSDGVDYGYTAYDFIYNYMISVRFSPLNKSGVNNYIGLLEYIGKVKISNLSIFDVSSKKILDTYLKEIAICLPLTIDYLIDLRGKNFVLKLFKVILSKSDEYLRFALLCNVNIQKALSLGVSYSISTD